MKAEELRIGNFVDQSAPNVFFEVTSIKKDRLVLDQKYGHHVKLPMIQDVKPIPITEEWLEKLGFELADKVNRCFVKCFNPYLKQYLWISTKGEYALVEGDLKGKINDFIPIVKPVAAHVHKVQNLWYALTGEELTIRLLINQ